MYSLLAALFILQWLVKDLVVEWLVKDLAVQWLVKDHVVHWLVKDLVVQWLVKDHAVQWLVKDLAVQWCMYYCRQEVTGTLHPKLSPSPTPPSPNYISFLNPTWAKPLLSFF